MKNKKELPLPPEEGFYQNAYHIPGGFATFNNVWVGRDIKGMVICTENLLVEKGIEIRGDVFCRKCNIKGKVQGNLYVWETLVIEKGGSVLGDITSKVLEIIPGALVNGRISMPSVVTMPEMVLNINPDVLKKYDNLEIQVPVNLPPTVIIPIEKVETEVEVKEKLKTDMDIETEAPLPIAEEKIPAVETEATFISVSEHDKCEKDEEQELLIEIETDTPVINKIIISQPEEDGGHWW